jgi:hypothetical protein
MRHRGLANDKEHVRDTYACTVLHGILAFYFVAILGMLFSYVVYAVLFRKAA